MAENDWKNRLGVVFSTNRDYKYDEAEEEDEQTLPAQKQKLIVSIDRRNRAGKQVTLVSGFVGSADDLSSLCKALKTFCGTGGSVKEGEILIQGDFRDKVVSKLKAMEYNAKRGN